MGTTVHVVSIHVKVIAIINGCNFQSEITASVGGLYAYVLGTSLCPLYSTEKVTDNFSSETKIRRYCSAATATSEQQGSLDTRHPFTPSSQ